MEVEIVGINHNGSGIGYIDGKVCFVDKTIPGDKVNVCNVVDNGNYYNALVDEFIKYSDNRCDIKCKYYDKCGGCQIMGMSYNMQLDYKRDKVIDIFKKYGNMDVNPSILGCNQYEYRNKVIFQVKDGIIGFYKSNSRDIVEVGKCLLINDDMNSILDIIRNNIDLRGIERLMIKGNLGKYMVVFYGSGKVDASCLYGKVSSIYLNDKCLYGDKYITMNLGEDKFNVLPEAFFQVNLENTYKLYSYVRDNIFVKDARILDLYCGVGSISIFCASKVRNVVGIEINESAIRSANINKEINNVSNVSFKCLNSNKIKYDEGSFDVVIVDPPRGGLDKKTINILKGINSREVIYVSCNPVTLVRDIKLLGDMYEIKDMKLFDLFPNSYHVESVVILERE